MRCCTLPRRRPHLTLMLVPAVLSLLVIFVYQTFVSVDSHQLTTYNSETRPSWRSRTWELLEDLYQVPVTWVYHRTPECQGCMEVDFPELLQPREICAGGTDPNMLLIIFTSVGEGPQRQVVRRTWLQASKANTGDVRYIFVVGVHQGGSSREQATLEEENKHYGDILQNDYIDSYRNMSIKTLAGLKWAVTHCRQVEYVMKVDSDTYLNLPKWWRLMFGPHKARLQDVVFGHCRRTPPVIRTPFHRYGVSVRTFAERRHPSFCRGPSYAMSLPLAGDVVKQSYKQPFIPVEDAYIGHCLRSLGRKVYNPPDINMLDLVEVKSRIYQRPCSLVDEFYVIHAVKSKELLELWKLASKCRI